MNNIYYWGFLLQIGHFDDMSVMTLVYLDSLVQRDNLQKSQYFKSLPNIAKQLPLVRVGDRVCMCLTVRHGSVVTATTVHVQ